MSYCVHFADLAEVFACSGAILDLMKQITVAVGSFERYVEAFSALLKGLMAFVVFIARLGVGSAAGLVGWLAGEFQFQRLNLVSE